MTLRQISAVSHHADAALGIEAYGITSELRGGAETVWILPNRQIGAIRHLAWLALLGVLPLSPLVLAPTALIGTLISNIAGGDDRSSTLIPLIFASVFAVVAFGVGWRYFSILLKAVGIATNNTSSVITIDKNDIIVQERMGRSKFQRIHKRDLIKSLHVVSSEEWTKLQTIHRRSKTNSIKLPEANNYVLLSKSDGNDIFALAYLYSKELLVALGDDISRTLKLQDSRGVSTVKTDGANLVARISNANPYPEQDSLDLQIESGKLVLTPPEGTSVELSRREDGLTFKIPSSGIWKGSFGISLFALIWTSISTILCCSTVYSGFQGREFGSAIFGFLFTFGFVCIGLCLFVFAVHLGTRKSLVATSYGSLFVSTESRIRKSKKEWEPETITDIAVAPSGMEVNDEPIFHIEIRTATAKPYGCLSQISPQEMNWIAAELRRDLALHDATKVASAQDGSLPESQY